MDDFARREGRLYGENVPLETIAEAAGTPAYVYSRNTLLSHLRRLREAWAEVEPAIRYAMKANGNLALLRVLVGEGAGFDVVSRGEIWRALKAGADPSSLDFAGVGKRRDEIAYGIEVGIGTFNVESEEELGLIDAVAREAETVARVALRVNPDVDAGTHRYITTGREEDKFGIHIEQADRLAARALEYDAVRLVGLHLHIGSQMLEVEPYERALERVVELVEALGEEGVTLEHLNLGGGFGIHYREDEAPPIDAFAKRAIPLVRDLGLEIRLEPGRLLVGNAGILLTRILRIKRTGDRRFVICDAGMNDLLRPSLYEGFHRIEPVVSRSGELGPADVVGPICESADAFGRDRPLPPLEEGDLLCIRSAGAYGFVMSSHYNARPRSAEVLVDGDRFGIVRERETEEDLIRGEHLEPRWL